MFSEGRENICGSVSSGLYVSTGRGRVCVQPTVARRTGMHLNFVSGQGRGRDSLGAAPSSVQMICHHSSHRRRLNHRLLIVRLL